jgi:hypothetical protein
VLVSYSLINTVTAATRVTKKSALLLDVMVRNHNPGQYSTEVINLGYSDHLGQLLTVSKIKQVYKPMGGRGGKKKNFSQENKTKFKDLLCKEDWSEVYIASMPDETYHMFLNRFLDCFKASFPVKLCKQGKPYKGGWITNGIKNQVRKRDY